MSSSIRPRPATVVIIGRPNVGKSSLFNRLYGRRRALVHDMPGVTRDRLVETVEWHRDRKIYRFSLVDTGGIGGESFGEEIKRQAAIALEGADLILWVIDSKIGLTHAEESLYGELKNEGLLKKKIPLAILANKVDDTSKFDEGTLSELYQYADHVLAVSAEHKVGIEDLTDLIVQKLSEVRPDFIESDGSEKVESTRDEDTDEDSENEADFEEEEIDVDQLEEIFDESEAEELEELDESDELNDEDSEEDLDEESEAEPSEPSRAQRKPRIAIVGKPNVGKSTLTNALLRQERMIVSPIAGTTIDSIDSDAVLDGRPVTLIDTAGFPRKNKTEQGAEVLSVIQTRKALERCDLAFFVLDASEGTADQDEKIGGLIEKIGCSVVLIMNKWDTQKRKADFTQKDAVERIRYKMPFLKYAPVVFLSAKERTGFRHLGDLVADILSQKQLKIKSHEFTEWVRAKAEVHNPWNVRFYFCHQTGRYPPSFQCLVSQPDKIDVSLERHLMNSIREEWGFMGTPIRIRFKQAKSKKYRPKPKLKFKNERKAHQNKSSMPGMRLPGKKKR